MSPADRIFLDAGLFIDALLASDPRHIGEKGRAPNGAKLRARLRNNSNLRGPLAGRDAQNQAEPGIEGTSCCLRQIARRLRARSGDDYLALHHGTCRVAVVPTLPNIRAPAMSWQCHSGQAHFS